MNVVPFSAPTSQALPSIPTTTPTVEPSLSPVEVGTDLLPEQVVNLVKRARKLSDVDDGARESKHTKADSDKPIHPLFQSTKNTNITGRLILNIDNRKPMIQAATKPKTMIQPRPRILSAEEEAQVVEIRTEEMKRAMKDKIGKSALTTRTNHALVKAGLFKGSVAKFNKFLATCRTADPEVELDFGNPFIAICSYCRQSVALKDTYQAGRFLDHRERLQCKPFIPPPPPDPTIRTLDTWGVFAASTSPPSAPTPQVLPCHGLTASLDMRIQDLLDKTGATGGGSLHINHYAA